MRWRRASGSPTVTRMARPPLALLALVSSIAFVSVACTSSASIAVIEGELTERIPEEVAELGVDVSGVDCPDDASVEAGSTFECDVTAVENDQDVIYTATVTIGSDDSASWELTDVRVAES